MSLPLPYYQDESVRIYHARCEDILPCLDLSEVACVLADPPYGIGVQKADGAISSATGRVRGSSTLANGGWRVGSAIYPDRIAGDDAPYALPIELAALLDHSKVCLFGANHYADCLPRSAGWLVWDKRHKGGECDFADAELAWTNFSGVVRVFRHYWNGMLRDSERGARQHPTQKPVALMKWVLTLAKLPAGALVLDPYTGSGPVLAAAKVMGYRAIGIDSLEWCCERAAERCRQEALPLTHTSDPFPAVAPGHAAPVLADSPSLPDAASVQGLQEGSLPLQKGAVELDPDRLGNATTEAASLPLLEKIPCCD